MNFTLTLAVRDLERTAAFYREVLGLEPEAINSSPGRQSVLLLSGSDSIILFREIAAIEAMHPALFQNLDRHPRGVGITLEFAVDDLRPILRAIERRHLHTLYDLEDEEFGRRELWLHDPDGYLVIMHQEERSPA